MMARRVTRRFWFGIGFGSFRKRKQGIGVDVGDGTALRKGDGDVRGGDMLREFGDYEHIEGTEGEERGLQVAAELFDGVTNGFIAIVGIVEQAFAGVCCVTDLMAKVGHVLPLSRAGAATV